MKKKACLLILTFCSIFCTAQQLVTSGGFAVQSDISVNWVLGGGISDCSTYNLSSLNKPQREQLTDPKIALKMFPNPASEVVNIEMTQAEPSRLILELCNNSGVKVLSIINSNQPIIQIDISKIPIGVYYLKVVQPASNNLLLAVEKIIKQ